MKAWAVTTFFLAGLEGGADIAGAGAEVDHRRHAAVGAERKEGDDGAGAGGQHHADRFATLGVLLQGRSKRKGCADDVVVGQFSIIGIVQDDLLAPIFLAGGKQRRENVRVGMAWIVGRA